MEVLAKLADCIDGQVCQISAFCKYQIPQPRSNIDDLLYSMIRQAGATCEVQYSQMFVCLVGRQIKECTIGYLLAVCKS